MTHPQSTASIDVNDYGTDDLGVRRVYLTHEHLKMEVTRDEGQLGLRLHHFTGQRRPVDMGKHLIHCDGTFDHAVKLGKVLLLGQPAASVNREVA